MSDGRRVGKRKAPEESTDGAEVTQETPEAKKPKVARKKAAPEEVVEGDCTICFENYKNDYGNLKCNHIYCFGCIEAWSKTENTCPLCKVVFTYIDRYDSAQVGANGKVKKKRVQVKRKTQRETLQEQHRQQIHNMLQTHVLPRAFGALVGGFLPMGAFAHTMHRTHHHYHNPTQDYDDDENDDDYADFHDDVEDMHRHFMGDIFGENEDDDEDHFGEEDDDEELDPDWRNALSMLFPMSGLHRVPRRGFHGSVVDLASDSNDVPGGSRVNTGPGRSSRGSNSMELIDLTGDDDETEGASPTLSNALTSTSSISSTVIPSFSWVSTLQEHVGSSSSGVTSSQHDVDHEVASSLAAPLSAAAATSSNDDTDHNVVADNRNKSSGRLAPRNVSGRIRSNMGILDDDDDDFGINLRNLHTSRRSLRPSSTRSDSMGSGLVSRSRDEGETRRGGSDAAITQIDNEDADGVPVHLVSATVLQRVNSRHRLPSANARQGLLSRGPGTYTFSTHVGPNGRLETTRTFVPQSENSS